MTKGYTIIEETDDWIQAIGFFDDYYAAIGKVVCAIADIDQEQQENGYSITSREDFFWLEMASGCGWTRTYHNSECDIERKFQWYVLLTDVNPRPEDVA